MKAPLWHLLAEQLDTGSPSLVVPLPAPSLLLAVRSPAVRVSLREMRVLRAQLVHFSSWLSQMTCRKFEVLWIMKVIVDVRAPRTC